MDFGVVDFPRVIPWFAGKGICIDFRIAMQMADI
jgi:hypothetical protein